MGEKIQLPDEEHEPIPDFLDNEGWYDVDIGPNILDVTQRYERPNYTLSYHGTPFAPLGGIHALTGQSGHGKTMTFTMMISALLGNKNGDLQKCDAEAQHRVLYIDTEMELGNTQLVNNRVYSMMGWQFGVPHDEFKVVMLREEVEASTRWKKTLKAIYQLRPTVVFIDGLLDVISDFNNNEECQKIIYECMATASHYGISMWCLVHENPGSTKMVGHLGSMLNRKVTDVFSTAKKKEDGRVEFTIKQSKARGKDVDEIRFVVNDGPFQLGEPQILEGSSTSAKPEAPSDSMLPPGIDWPKLMRESISSSYGIATRDLRDVVKREAQVGPLRADRIIKELERLEIIARSENKRYHIHDGAVNLQLFTKENEDCPF